MEEPNVHGHGPAAKKLSNSARKRMLQKIRKEAYRRQEEQEMWKIYGGLAQLKVKDRRIGVLIKIPAVRVKQLTPHARAHYFYVFVDIENLAFLLEDPGQFSFVRFRSKIDKFLRERYGQDSYVKKLTIVGNKNRFISQDNPLYYDTALKLPKGICFTDIYPMNIKCFHCPRVLLQAVDENHYPQDVFQRTTDIADCLIVDAMQIHFHQYGPCNFLLATDDKDFAESVRRLMDKEAPVYLAKSGNCSDELKQMIPKDFQFLLKDVLDVQL